MWTLPGSLTVGGVYLAEMTWGSYIALLGCFVVGAAALSRGRTVTFAPEPRAD
jgi:hypothetical protein